MELRPVSELRTMKTLHWHQALTEQTPHTFLVLWMCVDSYKQEALIYSERADGWQPEIVLAWICQSFEDYD